MARRIFIFSIGFFGGCIMVWFMFFRTGERSFYGNWLPEGRVLSKLKAGLDKNSSHSLCMLECTGIFKSQLAALLDQGDVLFSESKTNEDPREYEVAYQSIRMRFILSGDSVTIGVSPTQKPRTCDCP
jgi:hypothetical protein